MEKLDKMLDKVLPFLPIILLIIGLVLPFAIGELTGLTVR